MPMNAKIKSKKENSTFSRHEPTLYTLHGYRLQGGGRDIIEKRIFYTEEEREENLYRKDIKEREIEE